jgi:hypothetical protein
MPADRQVEGDDRMRRSEGYLNIAVTGAQHRASVDRPGAKLPGAAGVQYRRQLVSLN